MIEIFLSGDVMTGRGVDQILAKPSAPGLHEPYVDDARVYVELAERQNGPIARPVADSYVWGTALDELEQRAPNARIINLETSITTSEDFWRGKSIHYRMNPANTGCLQAARIDCCVLANNHVLDWGYAGLADTLAALDAAGLGHAGAGSDLGGAARPHVIEIDTGSRVLVFALGAVSSGIPRRWGAASDRPGVHLLDAGSTLVARELSEQIAAQRRPRDIVIVSVHWGGNWGYRIDPGHRDFAHALIDSGAVDVVHGHSSHHPKAIELYKDKPILYGCGDLLNDYEGISGHAEYRGDLALLYFLGFDARGREPPRLELVPVQIRQLRLSRPSRADAIWLAAMLDRECKPLNARAMLNDDNSMSIR